jgi:quinol monooxygenase YgiN
MQSWEAASYMSSIIVSNALDFEPGVREGLLDQAIALMEASVKESGCIAYMVVADPLSNTRIRIFEHWETLEALNNHIATDHVQEFIKAIGAAKPTAVNAKSYEATEFERRSPVSTP